MCREHSKLIPIMTDCAQHTVLKYIHIYLYPKGVPHSKEESFFIFHRLEKVISMASSHLLNPLT